MKPYYLFVTSFFPSPVSWRGAYNYIFIRSLIKAGRYHVRVFIPGWGKDYVYHGVQVYRFPVYYLPGTVLPFLFSWLNKFFFLRKVKYCGIHLDKVEVCHTMDADYALAVKSKAPKCTTLFQHHSLQSFTICWGYLRNLWVHKVWLTLNVLKKRDKMDCHIFISNITQRSYSSAPDTSWAVYEEYKKQMRGLAWIRHPIIKSSIILHHGVDVKYFNSTGRIKHKGFILGCVANFDVIKDQITLLHAVNLLKDQLGEWKLRLIGSGPLLTKCKAYVCEQGLEENVIFETEVDHTQLPDFYRSLDLFVLPSYFEGFGCVFTEAYACGTPFITCEGQGMDDLVLPKERHLWLCKPMDPKDLAEKILHFYHYRSEQHLSESIDSDVLVDEFLKKLKGVL